jgi:dolichol-phosphate mannosyltransferase
MPLDTPNPNALVAVCTYNEIANVAELTKRIFAALPDCHLLVIDDHSPDGTCDWVRDAMASEPRLRLIVRVDQRGLGGATRTALQYAVDQGYTFVMNLDGDLSHDPSVLPEMLALASQRPEIDVVVGSRYVQNGAIKGWPLRRRIMSRMVNLFATTVLGLPVSDCSGSIRCYRVSALASIDPSTLKSDGYAILEELLVRLRRNQSQMVEVPIEFIDRVRGSSKLTIKEMLRSIWQLILVATRSA